MVRNGTKNDLWLRQRTLAEDKIMQRMQISRDFIKNLKEEACFCLNRGDLFEYRAHNAGCLAWNQRGDLLANNSDETTIVVWDVYKKQHSIIETGHLEHILAVKFMPQSECIVTCSSDKQVRLTDRTTARTMFVCRSCHRGQIESLSVHPREPDLIWSAGERGFISQYDIRQRHVCSSSRPPNLITNIRAINKSLRVKCMDVNPSRSELLAVGSSDAYTRLFDRRALQVSGKVNEKVQSCVAQFVPGHIHRLNNVPYDGITSLAFNSDGSELLASVQREHIYLFNTYEPWQKCQSFEPSIRLLSSVSSDSETTNPLKRKRHEVSKRHADRKLPEDLKKICDDLLYGRFIPLWPDSLVGSLNKSLEKMRNCPELHTVYRARALALLRRGWLGDYYQALRDSCCALLLKPLDFQTILCLSASLIRIGDIEDASRWLEFVEAAIEEFGNHDGLLNSRKILLQFKQRSAPNHEEDNRMDFSHISVNKRAPLITRGLAYLPNYVFLDQLRSDFVKEISQGGEEECANPLDYRSRYCGHINTHSFSEVNFFGGKDEFVVSGSDDGVIYIWDKNTSNIIKAIQSNDGKLECVQPHPNICMLATSGHDAVVRLWSPIGKVNRDVEHIETKCNSDQTCSKLMLQFMNRNRR